MLTHMPHGRNILNVFDVVLLFQHSIKSIRSSIRSTSSLFCAMIENLLVFLKISSELTKIRTQAPSHGRFVDAAVRMNVFVDCFPN